MFTGLIRGLAKIVQIDGLEEKQMRFHVQGLDKLPEEGASIACNGCCLTALKVARQQDGYCFSADLSPETLKATGADNWSVGELINIEPSLRLGEEMGGHIVSGHVDGQAVVEKIDNLGGNHELTIKVPQELKAFVAPKGSVALNGVSLTVNAVHDDHFTVNIIPHTWAVTNLGQLKIGDRVNFEVDMLARYMARMLDVAGGRS